MCLENKPCFFFLPFFSFESGSHDVTQADLDLTMETDKLILLPLLLSGGLQARTTNSHKLYLDSCCAEVSHYESEQAACSLMRHSSIHKHVLADTCCVVGARATVTVPILTGHRGMPLLSDSLHWSIRDCSGGSKFKAQK